MRVYEEVRRKLVGDSSNIYIYLQLRRHDGMSAIATEAALRHVRGETVPREIILPVRIGDAANHAQWNRPFQPRSCPSWSDVKGQLGDAGPNGNRQEATRRSL